MSTKDQATQSNYRDITTTHIAFDWTLDWDLRTLSGRGLYTLQPKTDGVDCVVFDTLALKIAKVEVNSQPAEYQLGVHHSVMGAALKVPFSRPTTMDPVQVAIYYETTPEGSALQWLEKEYILNHRRPDNNIPSYLVKVNLYTPGRSPLCRVCAVLNFFGQGISSALDTSSVKFTWQAVVKSSLPVLLSAIRVSPPSAGLPHDGKTIGFDSVLYTFRQPIPVPPYLVAIAAGNLCYRAFQVPPGKTWSTGIWAEPEVIDAAHWEFCEDTPRFITIAEELTSPYQFGVFDMVVLPPAFPYGGMENACLTFLTPTLLSGDRSLVDVVAHELQHSWFGNGVTQANSGHFWINEGWATYMERLLIHHVYSPAARDFSFLLDFKSLQDALALYADRPKYQRLVIEFEYGENPDDAYSRVPYDKGANLLLYLERLLGGLDVFIPYMRDYVSTFMGQSITTSQWKDHCYSYFQKIEPAKVDLLNTVDWNAWLFGEGISLPVDIPYDTELADKAYRLAEKWNISRDSRSKEPHFNPLDVQGFNTNQMVVLLDRLQSFAPFSVSDIVLMGNAYGFRKTMNVEVRSAFYMLALGSSDASQFAQEIADWLIDAEFSSGGLKGRMKFCRPLFRAIYKTNPKLAQDVFSKYRNRFHPIARRLISQDLHLV